MIVVLGSMGVCGGPWRGARRCRAAPAAVARRRDLDWPPGLVYGLIFGLVEYAPPAKREHEHGGGLQWRDWARHGGAAIALRRGGAGTVGVREERGLRAEKGPYLPVKLLQCSNSARKACRDAFVGLQRRRGTELGGEVEEEWLRTPGSHEELRCWAVRPVIGSVRSKRQWWCGIAVADPLTGGGPWREIPRVQGLGSATASSEALLDSRRSSSYSLRWRR